ncbi:MAG: hypothetical protein JWO05_1730 [Gemmatimonadetes bacterium]|nr:hypothetical protein [Gemmatimonadota bacterium]
MRSFCAIVQGPGASPIDVDGDFERALVAPFDAHVTFRRDLEVTLAQVVDEHSSIREPLTLDGDAWLVGIVRLDARDALRDALAGRGVQTSHDVRDHDLVLHSWTAWGERCVEHLRGDFSLAIWSSRARTLFVARDQMGAVPCYVAVSTDGTVAVSDNVAALRCLPWVTPSLRETACADFVVFGYVQDLSATVLCDVDRLPAAHSMTVEGGKLARRQYWSLEAPVAEVRRSPREAAAEFRALLVLACEDRLRDCASASIFLSGGKDSTAVAAAARLAMGPGYPLHAITVGYARSHTGTEARLAAKVAARLGMSHQVLRLDDDRLCGARRPISPLPLEDWGGSSEAASHAAAAAHGPVVLTGFAGDPLLRETSSHLARMLGSGRVLQAVRESFTYARWHRRVPRPGFRSLLRPRYVPADVPRWLLQDFVSRTGIRERAVAMGSPGLSLYPQRPESCFLMQHPFWLALRETLHPAVTGLPLVQRHPLFDLRLMDFVRSIPPEQWYNDKGLITIGFRHDLPGDVVRREKSFGSSSGMALLARNARATGVVPRDAPSADWLDRIVRSGELPGVLEAAEEGDVAALRLHCLRWWVDSGAGQADARSWR